MLHYTTHGQGDPIYLLHGWALNCHVWDCVLPGLAQHGKIIAIDLPGHGKSALPSNNNYDLDTITNEVAQLIDTGATVVGWSLGGLVTLNLACKYPELVCKLVLVAGSPRFVRSPDWPNAVEKSVIDGFAHSLVNDYRATILRFLAIQALGSDQAKQSIKALREKVFINGEPQLIALQQGLKLLSETDLRTTLPGIRCPTLIVVGEKDTLIPANSGADTSNLLPNSQLAIIGGAGHAPFISHTEEFLRIVTAFINEKE